MSSETAFRVALLREFKRRGVAALSVEAGVGGVEVGTPDVAWARGWLELKVLPRWPRGKGGVKIEHFTREQLNWALRWVRGGGRYHILVRVPACEWQCEGRSPRGGMVAAFDGRGVIGVFTGVWPRDAWLNEAARVGTVTEVVEWLVTTGE